MHFGLLVGAYLLVEDYTTSQLTAMGRYTKTKHALKAVSRQVPPRLSLGPIQMAQTKLRLESLYAKNAKNENKTRTSTPELSWVVYASLCVLSITTLL